MAHKAENEKDIPNHPTGGNYVETYRGFRIYFARTSFNCPVLHEWGYAGLRKLHTAISRNIARNGGN